MVPFVFFYSSIATPVPFHQAIDLNSKSIDWFLYEGNTGI